MIPNRVSTPRLTLTPATVDLLRLELHDQAAFAARLGVLVPADWPPGEYDRDAIEFLLNKLLEGGEATVGWYGWYAALEQPPGVAVLIGCGGYFGPPDDAGTVEIGYSICAGWRGRGLAKELVRALVLNALALGATRILAHTDEDNIASVAVLDGSGFKRAPDPDRGRLLFQIEAES